MPENQNHYVSDKMIRDAIHRELDGIDVPPAEAAWQRFQDRLTAEKRQAPVPAARRAPWVRYSALAAALLFFIFGGWGLIHTLGTRDFHGTLLNGPPENDRVEINAAEEGVDTAVGVFGFPEGWNQARFSREVEQWPPGTLNGYLLSEVYTREPESGIPYLAALYTRGDAVLLWVQSETGSFDQFIGDIKQLFQIPLEALAPENALSSFAAGGGIALIWEKEGRFYLLWDPTGSSSEAELRRLILGL